MYFNVDFSVGWDFKESIDAFMRARDAALKEVLQMFGDRAKQRDEAQVEVEKVTREDYDRLIEFGKNTGREFSIDVRPIVEQQDMEHASYRRLIIWDDPVDLFPNAEILNAYPNETCSVCHAVDERDVPKLYRVDLRSAPKRNDILLSSNGISIAKSHLKEVLKGLLLYCDVGEVGIVGAPGGEKVSSQDYFWFRPSAVIGRYVDEFVSERCKVCGAPEIVVRKSVKDPFLRGLDIVDSFRGIDAPIVIGASWYGERRGRRDMSVSRDIFVNRPTFAFLHSQGIRGIESNEEIVLAEDESWWRSSIAV